MSLSRPITVVSNIVFIIVCIILTSVITLNYLRTSARADAEVLESGASVGGLGWLHPEEADLTVFVAISPDCRFCTLSMPFYARITAAAAQSRRRVRVVIAATAPVDTTKAYLARFGVHPASVVRLPGDIRLKGTPTLVLMSSTRTIVAGWFGRLSSRQEATLLTLLS
jgi:hypothetical protein